MRALILIDTQPGTEDPEVMESYQGMVQGFAHSDDETRAGVADIVADLIIGDPDLTGPWKAKWLADEPERILHPGAALLGRDDITDRLGEIECPAIVIHGTADAAIPIEKAEQLRAGLPGCRDLVAVDGAPHASNMTHPEVVNEAIRRFLAAL